MATDDIGWVYPYNKKHQTTMVGFMSWFHESVFPKNQEFAKDQLNQILPSNIKAYLEFRAYGKANPQEGDFPILMRAGSVEKLKQSISWYMPNKNVPWIDGRGGNPARHASLNEVIKKIERHEARDEGKDANDKRPYNDNEFFKLLEMLRRKEDFDHNMKYPMMSLWSYHLIHRLDDTCHFKVEHPHGSVEYPFAIFTKTRYSKNVRSIRDCPDQILLGADDWKVCPQLNLAIYLDKWLEMHPDAVHLFTTNDDTKKGPNNLKQQYANRIKGVVWDQAEFQALEDQVGNQRDKKGVGTHSMRKFASTKASRRGATPRHVEYRGRWVGDKSGRVVSIRYIDKRDDYVDAFVAGLLCNGGPIKYCTDLNITDDWLKSHVVSHVAKRIQDNRLIRILGLAKLWACFDPEAKSLVEQQDREYIISMFASRYGQPQANPVKKVPLEIYNVNGDLDIRDASTPQPPRDGATAATAAPTGAPTGGPSNEQVITYLKAVEQNMMQQFLQQQAREEAQRAWLSIQVSKLLNNQRRWGAQLPQAFSRQDPRQQAARREDADRRNEQQQGEIIVHDDRLLVGDDPHARLCDRPRSLNELWREFTHGIGDNKPAKDFTVAEKNNKLLNIKQKYWRRRRLWRVQAFLVVRCKFTCHEANAMIQTCYGGTVTSVINRIDKDSRNRNYPVIDTTERGKNFHCNPRLVPSNDMFKQWNTPDQ
ncbi:expressed unknown protein [Seminavis robusta]|uniref:Uncharacterized protein n=1 Tax=Seminavis robusta TaxID=568900 RepID=A0A9N8D523_9STRA|nr:expressed unknown protein [Seminavis robusta]|eukprot:Sro7_g005771.1  (706) ;mRNA; f:27120-29237